MVDIPALVDLSSSERFFALVLIIGVIFLFRYFKASLTEIKDENREREGQLIEMYKDQIEKADQREEKLTNHLDESTKHMKGIADTLKDVQSSLLKLEDRVEDNFMNVWKELGSKADRSEIQIKIKHKGDE